MARLSLRLLGPLEVRLDGDPVIDLKYDKVRALLAYLSVETARPHRREALAELFWPGRPSGAGRTNLRNALATLRRAIGDRGAPVPHLLISREEVQFNDASDSWVDVVAFEQLLSEGLGLWGDTSARPPDPLAVEQLEEAVTLYRGSFLQGFSLRRCPEFDAWLLIARERLQRQASSALNQLATYHEQRGEIERACDYVRRRVELEPWLEEAHRELMRLLALSGQRSLALAQYEICRRTLREELDVAPSGATTRLYEQIRTGAPQRAAAVAAAPRAHHNLPAQATPFVGRVAMLAQISTLLADPACRLLTLVGPGGSGKTRLALEAATPIVDHFEHGVFFVPLAGVESTESIAPAIAQAIGLPLYGKDDPDAQLFSYLRNRRMLLILDNFEHLLPRAHQDHGNGSDLVTGIVEGAPRVKVVLTSRAALRVRHEHLFPVTGMAYPKRPTRGHAQEFSQDAAGYSAVQLFVQSARRAEPGFELSPDNAFDVVNTCRLVGGLPLGVVLAAGWVRMLSPAETAGRLETGLDLLETDLHDVPARHRSMRAVFDHSWNLLTARQRAVMEALSVFRGGFTFQAARAVAGASLGELRSLVDRSLVQPAESGRYQIHELLRQYAADKLRRADELRRAEKPRPAEELADSPAASQAARERHAAYFTAALGALGESVKGPRQQDALLQMDSEVHNARAAWDWALEQLDVERLAMAAEGLGHYYARRGRHREADATFGTVTNRVAALAGGLDGTVPEDAVPLLLTILGFRAWSLYRLGRTDQAYSLLDQGIALAERPEFSTLDTRSEQASLWWVRGRMGLRTGRGEPQEALARSIALARSAGDRWRTARALCTVGRLGLWPDVHVGSGGALAESVAICTDIGDARGLADANLWLGWEQVAIGQTEKGEELIREGLSVHRELGDPSGVVDGLIALALTFVAKGDFAEAQVQMEKRVTINRDLGVRDSRGLSYLAKMLLYQGRYEEARARFQEALELAQETDDLSVAGICWGDLARLAILDGAYAEAKRLLTRSESAYEGVGYQGNVESVRWFCAYAERGLGEIDEARRHVSEALGSAADSIDLATLVDMLPAAALLLLDQGETERAVEICELARTVPAVASSQWHADVVGRPIADAAKALPLAVVEAARERGRARDMQATLKELAEEFEE
jgi:predicted ATPase/DNA-binding SARP family transcriptional activator